MHFHFLKMFVYLFFNSRKISKPGLSRKCTKQYLNAQNVIMSCEKKSTNFDMPKKESVVEKIYEKKFGTRKSCFLQSLETSKNMFLNEEIAGPFHHTKIQSNIIILFSKFDKLLHYRGMDFFFFLKGFKICSIPSVCE